MNYFANARWINPEHSKRSDNLRRIIGSNERFVGWGAGRTFTEVVFRKQVSTPCVRQRKIQVSKSDHLRYMIHPSPACNRVCTVCRLCCAVSVALVGDLASIKSPSRVHQYL